MLIKQLPACAHLDMVSLMILHKPCRAVNGSWSLLAGVHRVLRGGEMQARMHMISPPALAVQGTPDAGALLVPAGQLRPLHALLRRAGGHRGRQAHPRCAPLNPTQTLHPKPLVAQHSKP